MKKQLFGALLGGVMLAACTSDDVLNVSASQEANPQAPVFTVHFEGVDDTRAIFGLKDENGYTNGNIIFEPNDLLSLYHGVRLTEKGGSTSFTGYDWDQSLPGGAFTGYGNAVYEGDMDGEGTFTYTTKAMVNPGGAIMVYPADTAFVNTTGAIQITVPMEQNIKTRELTPYMSEVIGVEPYNKNEVNNVAGYDKKYDIMLKRVGASLALTINKLKDDATRWEKCSEPLKIRSIEIDAKTNGSTNLFTETVEITAGNKIEKLDEDKNPLHATWGKQTVATAKSDALKNSIKYTFGADDKVAENGNMTAYLTLLPIETNLKNSIAEYIDSEDEEKTNPITSVTVTVATNYGKVVVKEGENDKLWHQGASSSKIVEGLTSTLNVVLDAAKEGTTFDGEQIGKYAARSIDVDMSDLDMNGLHIANEQQLKDVVTVFKGLAAEKQKNNGFILDGDAKGEFVIASVEGLTAYADALALGATFTPCSEEAPCSTVVLTVGGAVPEKLVFGTPGVVVRLEGAWTLNKTNVYNGVQELQVAETATLALSQGTDEVIGMYETKENGKGVKYQSADASPWLVNKGTITVTGDVSLQMNTANYGTINIPADQKLRMEGYNKEGTEGVKLNNLIQIADKKFWANEAQGTVKYDVMLDDDIQGTTNGLGAVKRGTINVQGTGLLGVTQGTGGSVNNYGLIVAKDDPSLLITTNGVGTGDNNTGIALNSRMKFNVNKETHQLGTNDNIAGIIDLGSKTQNNKTYIYGKKGFILSTNNNGSITYLKNNTNATPTPIRAVVQFNVNNDKITSNQNIAALILPQGVTLSILSNVTTFAPGVSYLAGDVLVSGAFNYGINYYGENSYFGGQEGDWRHVTDYGKQQ